MIGRVLQTILTLLALAPADVPAPAAPPAGSSDGRLTARLETGDFSEFNQAEALHGELLNTTGRAYDGSRSMLAAYCAGRGNGYARGDFSVTLNPGNDVWYGAAFYLPTGFSRAMQGEVDLLRWDNFGLYGHGADYGGLVVWASDRKARLVSGHYGRGRQNVLSDPVGLPLGRWFWVEVHQHLSNRSSQALNEVWIDGRRVRRSSTGNSFGRRIDRVRVGLVAIEAGRQRRPIELWADRATVSPTMVGPGGAGTSGAVQSRGPHTPRRVGGRCG